MASTRVASSGMASSGVASSGVARRASAVTFCGIHSAPKHFNQKL